ncbi:hypothetical protein WN51_11230 [Melipona quadrifasciata]|uniref:Uncharacterized protein n=1 Tax=Melipona quadrifasciata TaxID=166423 RepID=A0A0M9A3Q6_9HYME|nr:hypothetical protein WN51_11230 [Melipona quadrifasciata]
MCSIHRCTLFWIWLENVHIYRNKKLQTEVQRKITNWERWMLPRCQVSGCVQPIGDSAPSWSGISPWLV